MEIASFVIACCAAVISGFVAIYNYFKDKKVFSIQYRNNFYSSLVTNENFKYLVSKMYLVESENNPVFFQDMHQHAVRYRKSISFLAYSNQCVFKKVDDAVREIDDNFVLMVQRINDKENIDNYRENVKEKVKTVFETFKKFFS